METVIILVIIGVIMIIYCKGLPIIRGIIKDDPTDKELRQAKEDEDKREQKEYTGRSASEILSEIYKENENQRR